MSDPAILEELGRRFKELRLRKDIRQYELAKDAGVSLGVVQRFETGKNISVETLIKMMRVFKLLENLNDLILEEP
ncbi:MAG: helix-turn-helix domain-containing protein [Mediterranea sp.]|jgi:transcriptional regulator with XRE-family HTH domain|nr:helix-turn-helix domain-containing protein [Mediterranea sp.]